jgi:acetyltransferase-like isoleucine patch superfamily enzyme
MLEKNLYIIGNGGHARSLKNLASSVFSHFIHIGLDADISDEDFLVSHLNSNPPIANGVGATHASLKTRNGLYSFYKDRGFYFINVIAESATISSGLSGEGIQIFHNTYVGPNVNLGNNIILNTGATVEHDSIIGDSSFVGPGAIICGGVTIGNNVFIGAGAIILPEMDVPANAVIPAGTRFPTLNPKNHKL